MGFYNGRFTINPMNVVFCAAEASPFAKVGGLGDVVGSLPKALARLGVNVMVCIPHYGCIDAEEHTLVETGLVLEVQHQGKRFSLHVMESRLPGSEVPIYLLGNHPLYTEPRQVYPQGTPQFEALRFEVLGQGAFQLLKALGFKPDILHLHDWHTANMACYLNKTWRKDPLFASAGTVLTIHNMAYQGVVGDTNWLKEGILHSDALVAVSPTYAREITTPQAGSGLEQVVARSQDKLCGILNGIDPELFNPATDPFIPCRFDPQTVDAQKPACKQSLQLQLGFDPDSEIPLFGMVSRLVEQKGLDLLLPLLPALAEMPLQMVILGAGQAEYEQRLIEMNRTSRNVRCMIGYNLPLGQQIYAGADMFLMPSRFEPCGLGQLIAMRYGTLPVVRKTGGLADTVFDVQNSPDPGQGNGFVFEAYSSQALLDTMQRAMAYRQSAPDAWWRRVKNAMQQDTSWTKSAQAYYKVYKTVCDKVLQRI